MNIKPIPQNATLGTLLRDRALRASSLRLSLDVALGSCVAAAMWWYRPRLWIGLTSAGLCLALYGVWAFAERALEIGPEDMPVWEEQLLAGLRVVTAIAGLAALSVLVFSVFSRLLGTWIS